MGRGCGGIGVFDNVFWHGGVEGGKWRELQRILGLTRLEEGGADMTVIWAVRLERFATFVIVLCLSLIGARSKALDGN